MKRTAAALAALAAAVVAPDRPAIAQAPTCEPGGTPVELDGTVRADQVRTYLELPVDVADGTTRVEVTRGKDGYS